MEKEFLTVNETAILLKYSSRTIYRFIENGTIKAVNLAERMTRIKASEIDKFLEQKSRNKKTKKEIEHFDSSNSYTIGEIQTKYKVSQKALYSIIKRENLPKFKKGKYVYVPKKSIDEIFG